ncbi:MAG: hypothetical protein P9L99_13000 [Candidatus Lernaella stagnicola]|nr:hypothetical protein [Candidatus Lernaella stagnicola]
MNTSSTSHRPKAVTERPALWWAALFVFAVLVMVRALGPLPTQLTFPRYEDVDAGNITKDILDGTLVTGVLEYANAPAYTLVKGFLALPLFALFGKTNLCLIALTFLICLAALAIILALIRRHDRPTAALWAMPALVLMPDLMAANFVNFDANHLEQLLWTAMLLALLWAYWQDARRWWAPLLFGLVAGLALFSILSNLVTLAVLAVLALALLDKRRVFLFTCFAAPGLALFLLLRLGVERSAYGFLPGDVGGLLTRLTTTVTQGLPAVFGRVPTQPIAVAVTVVLALFWLALAVLRGRDILTALGNLIRLKPKPIEASTAIDLFLLLFVPAWLAAGAVHAWGVDSANARYLVQAGVALLIIPGRVVARTRWAALALVVLLGLQLASIQTRPSVAAFNTPEFRSSTLFDARGVRGYFYPLYTKRGLAAHIVSAHTPEEKLAVLQRVPDPWKTWALRDAAHRAAFDGYEPLGFESFDLPPAWQTAWREGTAAGVTERVFGFRKGDAWQVLSEVDHYLGRSTATVNGPSAAAYQGMGYELMRNVIGLGSPDEAIDWAAGGRTSSRFTTHLERASSFIAALPPDGHAALAIGMGRFVGERRLDESVSAALLAAFFTAAGGRVVTTPFYRGVGVGQAETQFTLRRQWTAPLGHMCADVPPDAQRACDEAMLDTLERYGFTVSIEDTPPDRFIRLEDEPQ